jgi:hypothetical protein
MKSYESLIKPDNEPPAAHTILELDRIKVTSSEEQKNEGVFYNPIVLHCKSWMCPSCRIPKGLSIRRQLLGKVNVFKVPRLYTVTVNRDYFESPEAAYMHVMRGKFLARLLTKEMGVVRWFWVLEAQEETGDGWPHWHILMDVGELPGMWYHKESQTAQANKPDDSSEWCYVPHFFDLNRVHRLLRKWKIGEQCKLSVRRDDFQSPEHAVNYITKYLINPPERGFPAWMLNHKGLRFYQPSRAVGAIGEQKKQTVPKYAKEPSSKPRRSHRPAERIAECGKVLFTAYTAMPLPPGLIAARTG